MSYGSMEHVARRYAARAGYKPAVITNNTDGDAVAVNAGNTAKELTDATGAGTAAKDTLLPVLAPGFDATKTYAKGAIILTKSSAGAVSFYVCTTAIAEAAAWDATKWTAAATLADAILLSVTNGAAAVQANEL